MTTVCAHCGTSSEGRYCSTCAGYGPSGLKPPAARPAVTRAAPSRPAASSGATAAPGYGQAKFVGDAAPVGGIPLSRIFNSLCYVIAGIALLVMSGQPGFPSGGSMAFAIIIGLGAILYGAKILLTRTSYWVSSWVYLLAFGAVAVMFGFLSHS